MARSEHTAILSLAVEPDGQVVIYEQLQVWEGGIVNGYIVATGPRTGRNIDVGDDTSGEDQLVLDTINGNLHTQARIDARDAEKAKEVIN